MASPRSGQVIDLFNGIFLHIFIADLKSFSKHYNKTPFG